jgi:hypothetical protein
MGLLPDKVYVSPGLLHPDCPGPVNLDGKAASPCTEPAYRRYEEGERTVMAAYEVRLNWMRSRRRMTFVITGRIQKFKMADDAMMEVVSRSLRKKEKLKELVRKKWH